MSLRVIPVKPCTKSLGSFWIRTPVLSEDERTIPNKIKLVD
jgi:hypothetical protein